MTNVSIIVPVKIASEAEYKRTIANLTWLKSLEYSLGAYEVIVIDNLSVRSYTYQLRLFCDNFGYQFFNYTRSQSSYAARNRGVVAARYEVLTFIDADCTPSINWLQNGVEALIAGDCGIVAGMIEMTYRKQHQPNLIEYLDTVSHLRQRDYAAYGYSATGNMFTWAENFKICGLFPEVKSLGDREWCQNTHLAVSFCAAALVFHPARYTLRSLLRKVSMQAYALHRLNPVRFLDLLRFTIPFRTMILIMGDDQLPRLWNKLGFLVLIQLYRTTCLIQSWRAMLDNPYRVSAPSRFHVEQSIFGTVK